MWQAVVAGCSVVAQRRSDEQTRQPGDEERAAGGFCPAQEGGVAKVNSRQLAFNTLHKIQEPPAMQVVVLLVCCDDPRVQGWMLHIIKELSMKMLDANVFSSFQILHKKKSVAVDSRITLNLEKTT
ncbi:hypothetical protein OsI_33546 [Oryza sativa Indica Group]|uniref:Uncharacterized protein n=1 Tax=Oryza sativa subsp. indica TaxID=39946 RepID=B8BGT1_ORYSI|nr:hypothetical protein OsI_33546 [Oryza sativa Indica Group]